MIVGVQAQVFVRLGPSRVPRRFFHKYKAVGRKAKPEFAKRKATRGVTNCCLRATVGPRPRQQSPAQRIVEVWAAAQIPCAAVVLGCAQR